jgi:hypothetical protein
VCGAIRLIGPSFLYLIVATAVLILFMSTTGGENVCLSSCLGSAEIVFRCVIDYIMLSS